MDAKQLAELLQKYEEGKCSEEERLMIDKFYQDFEADEDTLPATEAMQPVYDALYNNINIRTGGSPVPMRSRRQTWQYAAAAVILLSVGLGAWYLTRPVIKPTHTTLVAQQEEKYKKRFIKLPDGSTVLLNGDSKLEYPATFKGPLREVKLVGEGYFDIANNSKQPFIVRTGNVVTTVLGTVFNIKAKPGEEEVTVTVEKGKVKVEAGGQAVGIIGSNEQIQVNRATAFAKNDTVNVKPVTEWVKADLVFNNVTYAEAAKVLMEQYGINIVFKDPQLQQCRFTTSFKNQSSLEDILTVLCAFNQSAYSITDSTVTIEGGGCK